MYLPVLSRFQMKPLQWTTFLTASLACSWVCYSWYNGEIFAQCMKEFWCKSCIARANCCCPQRPDSTSPALSSTQNACVCSPGYSSQGTVSGTSPCALCQPGSVCPGSLGIVSVPVEVQVVLIPNFNATTQLMLVTVLQPPRQRPLRPGQRLLPVADNLVSLFVSILDSRATTLKPAIKSRSIMFPGNPGGASNPSARGMVFHHHHGSSGTPTRYIVCIYHVYSIFF